MTPSTENLIQHAARSFHETFGQGGWIAPNILRAASALGSHQLITHHKPVIEALTSLAGRASVLPGAAKALELVAGANAAIAPFAATTVATLGASLATGCLATYAINSVMGPSKGTVEKEQAELRNYLTRTERQRYGRTYQGLPVVERMKQLETSLAEALQAKEAKLKAMSPTPAPVPSAAALNDISGTQPAPQPAPGGAAPTGAMTPQQIAAFIQQANTLPNPQAAFAALPPAHKMQVQQALALDALLHPQPAPAGH